MLPCLGQRPGPPLDSSLSSQPRWSGGGAFFIAPKGHRGPLKWDQSSLSSLLIRAASLLPEFPLTGPGQALGAPNPCAPLGGARLPPQPYLSTAAIADSPAACLPLPPASLRVSLACPPPLPSSPLPLPLLSSPSSSFPLSSPPSPSTSLSSSQSPPLHFLSLLLPLPCLCPLLGKQRSWGPVDSGLCTHSSKVNLQGPLDKEPFGHFPPKGRNS